MKNAVIEHDLRIVPSDRFWGPGYGKPYAPAEMDSIAAALASNRTDVPKIQGTTGWSMQESRIIVQSGFDAPLPTEGGALDPALPTDDGPRPWMLPQAVETWMRERGWDCDQHGRGWHPHYRQLLDDKRISLHTGIGIRPWYGEQVGVDVVVVDGDNTLLMQRKTQKENGKKYHTLFGGRVQVRHSGVTMALWQQGERPVTHDSIFAAVVQCTSRDVGRKLPLRKPPRIVWAQRPVAVATTLNAWQVRYTVLLEADLEGLKMRPHIKVMTEPELVAALPLLRVSMRKSLQAARQAL